MKLKILLVLVGILLFSCTEKKQDSKMRYNKNKPTRENLTIKLKKKFELIGSELENEKARFSLPTDLAIDEKQNLYLIERATSAIKKFDKDGNFITSFGRAGKGPGEFENLATIFIYKDTICTTEWSNNFINKFTKDGKFIRKDAYGAKSPRYLTALGDNLVGFNFGFKTIDGKPYLTNNFDLMDNRLQLIHNLLDLKILESKQKENPLILYPGTTVGKDQVFVAANDKYQIDVFNKQGLKEYSIVKNAIREKYSPVELENLLYLNKAQNTNVYKKENFGDKKFIFNLFLDKYDNLWASRGYNKTGDKLVFDLFKDGVYLNKIELGLPVDRFFSLSASIKFVGDFIYVANIMEGKVLVYEYEIL